MNSLFQTITTRQDEAESNILPLSTATPLKKKSNIIIRDLELMMFIGVFDSEKSAKQKVTVNCELEVIPNDHWQNDDIDGVVSYADIIDRIQMISNGGHINLVETFAEKIAEMCFSYPEIIGATIRIEKPDIIENTGAVGVELSIYR